MQITLDIPDWIVAEYIDADRAVEDLVLEDILLARESEPGPECREHIRDAYDFGSQWSQNLRTSRRS